MDSDSGALFDDYFDDLEFGDNAAAPVAEGDSPLPAGSPASAPEGELVAEFEATPVPTGVYDRFARVAEERGGASELPKEYVGSVARTMFDTPQSKDDTVTILVPNGNIRTLPTQSLVRIHSVGDGLKYLGAVVAGPFAEPDGLRADSPIVVSVTVNEALFMPPFHGRVQVEILGEETPFGLVPPRFRPLPNSAVFPLDSSETAAVLHVAPEPEDLPVPIGLAVGHDRLTVAVPGRKMSVLPRHVGVLGTTGGGKSTTVSGLIDKLQRVGYATVLIDTEGEYTTIDQPTDDTKMQRLLVQRGLKAEGVNQTTVYRLAGKETTNPNHPDQQIFSLPFENLSPRQVSEILEMPEAQDTRFVEAYDTTRRVMSELKIFPSPDSYIEDEKLIEKYDELETGYPRMRLEYLDDVIQMCALSVKKDSEAPYLRSATFRNRKEEFKKAFEKVKGTLSPNFASWFGLLSRVRRLGRMGVFDVTSLASRPSEKVASLDFAELTRPGNVAIFDLSDTDSPQINNLVIAEILRGVHEQQDLNFKLLESKRISEPRRTMIVIEEAHEFLSRERIKQMPVLFEQVARVARRGRKRWLGLMFVTQLPQHLPDEVLGLINNFILHKISDDGVVSRLRRTIGGIDESLWSRLSNLAPGQAIVSATSLARPMLVAIHPTPCKLRMAE